MTKWREEDGVRWRSLDPFGIEIDLDLSAPLSASAAGRLRDLFRDYGLMVAHKQRLSPEQQTAFCALFGPILRRSFENGYITTEHENRAALSELPFHSDNSYTKQPFGALSLHAVDVVDGASATRFASAERCYETLPASLRDRLNAHAAEMVSPGYEALAMRAFEQRAPSVTHRAQLPSVLNNPRTGRRYIAVSEMQTARLLGLDWAESRDLLRAVFDHLYAAENTTEHVWRNGDLVLWDNLAYQHARRSLDGVGRRVLQRVIVGTDRAR